MDSSAQWTSSMTIAVGCSAATRRSASSIDACACAGPIRPPGPSPAARSPGSEAGAPSSASTKRRAPGSRPLIASEPVPAASSRKMPTSGAKGNSPPSRARHWPRAHTIPRLARETLELAREAGLPHSRLTGDDAQRRNAAPSLCQQVGDDLELPPATHDGRARDPPPRARRRRARSMVELRCASPGPVATSARVTLERPDSRAGALEAAGVSCTGASCSGPRTTSGGHRTS